MDTIKDKVAVVTGSAQGIGKAVVFALARNGTIVYCLDINDEENQKVADQASVFCHNKCIAYHCDLASVSEINEIFNRILSEVHNVDILINNAGVFTTESILKDSFETILKHYDLNMNVNARGTLLCIKKVADKMAEQGYGEIINVNTNHVKRQLFSVSKNEHNYDASKYAQLAFNESIARELKEAGIRVNAVCPAATRTVMLNNFFDPSDLPLTAERIGKATRHASLLEPEEVAKAIIGMLLWPSNAPFGKEYLLMFSEDCVSLSKRPVEILAL